LFGVSEWGDLYHWLKDSWNVMTSINCGINVVFYFSFSSK
jgi:hypothetical protein